MDTPYILKPEKLLTHHDFLRTLARSLLRDKHHAEDIVQQTWLTALEKGPREETALRGWLAGTTRNLVKRLVRTEKRLGKREKTAARAEAVRSTDELVSRESARRKVVDAVLQLKEPYRSSVLFRFYDDLPPREIARRHNIPVETVKTRIQRGLAILRSRLEDDFIDSEKDWRLAIAPIAGIKLNALTAGAKAFAFSLKAKVSMAVAAIAVILSALVFLTDDDDALIQEGGRALYDEENAAPVVVIEDDDGQIKQAVLPDEGDQPDSYKKALGGIKGRISRNNGDPLSSESVQLLGLKGDDFFQGRIDDPKSGSPLLELRSDQTRTDSEGSFCFTELLPRGYYILVIHKDGQKYATHFVDVQPGPGKTVDLGEIILDKSRDLKGCVTDLNGKPLEGARVVAAQLPDEINTGILSFKPGSSFIFEFRLFTKMRSVIDPPSAFSRLLKALPFHEAETGKDGGFSLNNIPVKNCLLLVERAGYSTTTTIPDSFCSIRLEKSVTLKARVFDHKNKPVPGIEVRIGPDPGDDNFSLLAPPLFTQTDGSFVAESVKAGPACCVFRRFQEDPWIIEGPVNPHDKELIFHLPRTCNVELKIVDKYDIKVKDAELKIRVKTVQNFIPSNIPVSVKDRIKISESGNTTIKDMSPGKYEILVTAPGYGTAVKEISVKDKPVREKIVLQSASSVSINVFGGKDKAPLEWVDVMIYPEPDKNSHRAIDTSTLNILRSRTDDNGLAHFEKLSEGKYGVTLSHPGYAILVESLILPEDEKTEFLMKPGIVIEGRVDFEGSNEIPPFTILLEPRWDVGLTLLGGITVTDTDGRFRVENMNPGKWEISVLPQLEDITTISRLDETLARDYFEIAESRISRVTINLSIVKDLAVCSSVSGRVLFNGLPVENTAVTLDIGNKHFKEIAGESGSYSFKRTPVGKGIIRINTPQESDSPGVNMARKIMVKEAPPHTENFEIQTGVINGIVRSFADKKPLCGIKVSAIIRQSDELRAFASFVVSAINNKLENGSSSIPSMTNLFYTPIEMSTITDLDGAFRFPGAPVGVYCVEAKSDQYGCPSAVDVKVTQGAASDQVVLELYTPVTVKGFVKLPKLAGDKILNMLVSPVTKKPFSLKEFFSSLIFSNKIGGDRIVEVNNGTGAFEITRLMPGIYKAYLISVPEEIKIKEKVKSSFERIEFFLPMKFEVTPFCGQTIDLYPVRNNHPLKEILVDKLERALLYIKDK